jgi:hypothetical protein
MQNWKERVREVRAHDIAVDMISFVWNVVRWVDDADVFQIFILLLLYHICIYRIMDIRTLQCSQTGIMDQYLVIQWPPLVDICIEDRIVRDSPVSHPSSCDFIASLVTADVIYVHFVLFMCNHLNFIDNYIYHLNFIGNYIYHLLYQSVTLYFTCRWFPE